MEIGFGNFYKVDLWCYFGKIVIWDLDEGKV